MPTQAQVSRDWKTSREYIRQCVARGCPIHSFRAARLWRDAYARQRPPTDRKQLELLVADNKPSKTESPRKKPFQGIIDRSCLPSDPLKLAVNSARWAEQKVSILLRQASEERDDSKIFLLLIAYNKALEGRLNTEKLCRAEIEHRQNLISIKVAGELAARGLNVMISRIVALPKKNGSLINPRDSAQATAVLRDECTNLILDAKKSCPKAMSEAVRWPNIS
jgi:hypothetical protein